MDNLYDVKKQSREQWMLNYGPIAQSLSMVKHKIAIFSGKGGVGKTTATVNIAVSLAKKGYKVGILDADVHGPAVPKILGASGKLDVSHHRMHHKKHQEKMHHEKMHHEKMDEMHAEQMHAMKPQNNNQAADMHNFRFDPINSEHGVKMVSVDSVWPGQDSPIMWRGPHKMRMIRQFLSSINWGHLDFLFIDLPPGTGDEVLTIMSSIPELDGMVVVSTPQDVSTIVCSKAINTAKEMSVPILGVLENMSVLCCPHCNNSIKLFGNRSAKRLARMMDVEFLGSIPFLPEVNESSDAGIPVVVKYPESTVSIEIGNIAESLVTTVKQAKEEGEEIGS